MRKYSSTLVTQSVLSFVSTFIAGHVDLCSEEDQRSQPVLFRINMNMSCIKWSYHVTLPSLTTAALGLILKSCLIRPFDQLMIVEVKPDICRSPLKALFIWSQSGKVSSYHTFNLSIDGPQYLQFCETAFYCPLWIWHPTQLDGIIITLLLIKLKPSSFGHQSADDGNLICSYFLLISWDLLGAGGSILTWSKTYICITTSIWKYLAGWWLVALMKILISYSRLGLGWILDR